MVGQNSSQFWFISVSGTHVLEENEYCNEFRTVEFVFLIGPTKSEITFWSENCADPFPVRHFLAIYLMKGSSRTKRTLT